MMYTSERGDEDAVAAVVVVAVAVAVAVSVSVVVVVVVEVDVHVEADVHVDVDHVDPFLDNCSVVDAANAEFENNPFDPHTQDPSNAYS